ncbi:MAG: hypothetical protein KA397_04285, partial [Paludibacteraceae bacterium]|nr:hypothetical protein [Paludibacteraceae bacterium]
RKVGKVIVIDIHIKLDRNISFVESHDIATALEMRLRKHYGQSTVSHIHTEPFDPNKDVKK